MGDHTGGPGHGPPCFRPREGVWFPPVTLKGTGSKNTADWNGVCGGRQEVGCGTGVSHSAGAGESA